MRKRLQRHLESWLGAWPPTGKLVVATAPGRVGPGWDGRVHPVIGVGTPDDGTVLSLPPDILGEASHIAARGGLPELGPRLGPLLGRPGDKLRCGVFRWSEAPAPSDRLPDAGEWFPAHDPGMPAWLRPFGGEVLAAVIDGQCASGVGLKRHDRFGRELAVVTAEEYQGRGLGRRLVAQAARRVVEEGMVPTYLHDPANVASGMVAEAAGFPERGWTVLGLW